MKEWYALHTKPYSERKVAVRLDRHDIETYVPETKSDAKRANGRRIPFFPGYMFINLDMQEANPSRWRYTPGVRYIVSYGDKPIAVSEELIRTIQKQLAALREQHDEGSRPAKFKPGDRVRVTKGPLQDMVAIFDGPTEPAERVRILLEVMSRYRRIRISQDALEKVDTEQDKQKKKRGRRTRGRGRPIRSD